MPLIDKNVRHVAITWTSVGGLLDVIVDGVLQASLKDFAKNKVVPAPTKVHAGGRGDNLNSYEGYLFEVNIWDHVLPVDLLYLMARYKGNDCGNLAAWKGFKPSSDQYFEKTPKNMKPQGNTIKYSHNFTKQGAPAISAK